MRSDAAVPTTTASSAFEHKILQTLLPEQGHVFVRLGEIAQRKLTARASEKFLSERGDGHRGVGELLVISEGFHCVDAIAEQIPVEQETKPIVIIPTDCAGVCAARAISGLGTDAVEFDVDPLGVTHPAGDHANATEE